MRWVVLLGLLAVAGCGSGSTETVEITTTVQVTTTAEAPATSAATTTAPKPAAVASQPAAGINGATNGAASGTTPNLQPTAASAIEISGETIRFISHSPGG